MPARSALVERSASSPAGEADTGGGWRLKNWSSILLRDAAQTLR